MINSEDGKSQECLAFYTSLPEGDIGVCKIAVLDNFSCGILVILISKCGITVFSELAGCDFLASLLAEALFLVFADGRKANTRKRVSASREFFSILDVIKNDRSSPPTFSERFPDSDWIFPMKFSSHGNGKLQYLLSLL